METLDEVLAHYGILGMKWGVRRSDRQLARARGRRKETGKPVTPTKKAKREAARSEDAKAADEAKKKAKKSGPSALSNQELQQLNTRLNLEQQYNKLAGQRQSSAGATFARDLLINVGKQQATRMANDQVAKLLRQRS